MMREVLLCTLTAFAVATTSAVAAAQEDESAPSTEEVEEKSEARSEPDADKDEKPVETESDTADDAPADTDEDAAGETEKASPAPDDAEEASGADAVTVPPGPPASDPDAQGDVDLAGRTQEEEKTQSAAALGAGSPMVSQDEAAKPWTLAANASLNVGSSILSNRIDDSLVTFSSSFTGLYKILNLGNGRVDAVAQLSFSQVLDASATGNLGGGVTELPFLFNDIPIGLLGRSLFVEKNTGIIFGGNLIFRLPTSDLAQAFDRTLRTDLSVNATKVFSGVGPGTIVLGLSETFRYDLGPNVASIDESESITRVATCNSRNTRETGECFSDQSNLNFALLTNLNARYLMNFGLNFSLSTSLFYNVFHRGFDPNADSDETGDTIGGIPIQDVGNSPNSTDAVPGSLLWVSSISLGYVITPNLSVNTGVSTFRSVFQQLGNNSSSVAQPFFADDPETNASSFFLTLSGNY